MAIEKNKIKKWNEIPFSDCLQKVKIGKGKQVKERDYLKIGSFPIVDQGKSFIAGFTNDKSKVISEIQPFIIFGDHTRILKYIDFPITLGADGTKVIKPTDDFDTNFFFYFLKYLDIPSRGYNRHFTLLKEKNILQPPLAQQKVIAKTLSSVQGAIAGQEELIIKLKELKQCMMQQLFTHGTKGEKTKMTEIGEIPESWEIMKIGDIANAKGGFGFPLNRQGKNKGQFPFYKVSDMNLVGNEKYMTRSNNWIETEDLVTLKAKTYPKNAIIFPKVGATIYTNKKRLLTCDSVVDNNVMAVVINDISQCNHEFLFQWFQSMDLAEFANVGTVPSITSNRIHSSLFPFSTINEQNFIAESLLTIDQKVFVTQEKLSTYQNLFKTLLHELMSGERILKG